MKSHNFKKIQFKTIALAVVIGFPFSALTFGADTSQLIGKDLDQNRDLVSSVMNGRNYLVQVDQQGKIKQVFDTGENGNGSDPFPPTPMSLS